MKVLHFDACAQVGAAKFIDKENYPGMTDKEELLANAMIWTDIGIVSLVTLVTLRIMVVELLSYY